MKTLLCVSPARRAVFMTGLALCMGLAVFVSCGSPPGERYRLVFPDPPGPWTEMLGPPRWRVEWSGGGAETSGFLDISLPGEWSGAVLAWPFWPDRGLPPGVFCPAGGIFPFDAAGDALVLGWEGGPPAFLFRELRRTADGGNHTGAPRRPEYFDWPRFRSFLRNEAPEELRSDPWRADWKAVAGAAVRSGFSKTLVKAAPRTETPVTIPHDGPWLGASPFEPVRFWEPGEVLLYLPAGPSVYVCPGGILTLSGSASAWRPFPEGP